MWQHSRNPLLSSKDVIYLHVPALFSTSLSSARRHLDLPVILPLMDRCENAEEQGIPPNLFESYPMPNHSPCIARNPPVALGSQILSHSHIYTHCLRGRADGNGLVHLTGATAGHPGDLQSKVDRHRASRTNH
jgi:hypothetical protein